MLEEELDLTFSIGFSFVGESNLVLNLFSHTRIITQWQLALVVDLSPHT